MAAAATTSPGFSSEWHREPRDESTNASLPFCKRKRDSAPPASGDLPYGSAITEPKSSKLVTSGAVFFPLFCFLPFPPFIQNVTALQRRATPRHTRAPPARAPPARPLLTNSPARHPSCRSWPRCFLHSRRLPSKGPSAPLRTSCERRCASGVENVASPSVECPLFLSNNLVEVSILPEKRC